MDGAAGPCVMCQFAPVPPLSCRCWNAGKASSGPIASWQIDGETVERVADFILGGSKITADGDCSHEIKRAYSLEGKL